MCGARWHRLPGPLRRFQGAGGVEEEQSITLFDEIAPVPLLKRAMQLDVASMDDRIGCQGRGRLGGGETGAPSAINPGRAAPTADASAASIKCSGAPTHRTQSAPRPQIG